MAQVPERKLFLGPRLRRLRRDMGLSQTRMAEDLGVSPSYLNYMEHNRRPVTAQVLLKLAEAYNTDIRTLSAEHDPIGVRDLSQVLADPIFNDLPVARHEIGDAAEYTPSVADAVVRLYQAYVQLRRQAERGAAQPVQQSERAQEPHPSDWVRDYIQRRHNFFPELENAGEA